MRALFVVVSIAATAVTPIVFAQNAPSREFVPVTDEMLRNPRPEDWLMFSRTYDAQRFSPLNQINKQNVAALRLAWTQEMGSGLQESIPIVYRGMLYAFHAGATIQAFDAAKGDIVWEYKRSGFSKTKGLAIYEDLVYFTTPDGALVALDALNGDVRWETKVGTAAGTSGPIVVEGKVVTGRACAGTRESCFIAAHDARTGKELWKFYTVPAKGEPGSETWGPKGPADNSTASTWGLMGSYDPDRKLIYWGIADPLPLTRIARHDGDADAIPLGNNAGCSGLEQHHLLFCGRQAVRRRADGQRCDDGRTVATGRHREQRVVERDSRVRVAALGESRLRSVSMRHGKESKGVVTGIERTDFG